MKADFIAYLENEFDIDTSVLGIEWVELTTADNKVADLGALVNAGDFDIIVGCGNNVDSTAGVTIVKKGDINPDFVAAGRKVALLDENNALAEYLYDFLTYVAPVEIDKIDVSGITAPVHGQTVAEYAASFVPVLPEGAKYSISDIVWYELDPETMMPTTEEPLADDYVFDSSKTYGFVCTMQPEEGYVFDREAVITANGGALELFDSIATNEFAGVAVVFNPAPDTGDNSAIAIFAIAAVATIGCVALALRKKKED
jgi:LPXTG-motif cell wall-anchored protein